MGNKLQLRFQFAKKKAIGFARAYIVFLVACAGEAAAQEMTMLDYWWVRPRELPENAPRVIRVIGAKGERFEEVYSEGRREALMSTPAVMEARAERQATLRRKAVELAYKMMNEGEVPDPGTAYEKAWAKVFRDNWITANNGEGSSRLEDLLAIMVREDGEISLTEEDRQWILEALLEDDDRLESEAGRRLLENLVHSLREIGFGNFYSTSHVNDELMKHFVEALRQDMDSMSAYRDAMFKTLRETTEHHYIKGYYAPWGTGPSVGMNGAPESHAQS